MHSSKSSRLSLAGFLLFTLIHLTQPFISVILSLMIINSLLPPTLSYIHFFILLHFKTDALEILNCKCHFRQFECSKKCLNSNETKISQKKKLSMCILNCCEKYWLVKMLSFCKLGSQINSFKRLYCIPFLFFYR